VLLRVRDGGDRQQPRRGGPRRLLHARGSGPPDDTVGRGHDQEGQDVAHPLLDPPRGAHQDAREAAASKGRALRLRGVRRLARRHLEPPSDRAIVLVAVTMVGTTLLLLWEATLVQSSAVRANPPSPELLLGLPGINPIIPVGYGIFGLAVAIILHEFSHGILARVAKIRIRSLGLIFLIFPIGAFVEPDEEELRALPRRDRARLFAAGPAT